MTALHHGAIITMDTDEVRGAFALISDLLADRVIYTAGMHTPAGPAHIIITRTFYGFYYPRYESPTLHCSPGAYMSFDLALRAIHEIALSEAAGQYPLD